MNQQQADERSETYRERLANDIIRVLRSRFTSGITPSDFVIEELVNIAMGPIDQLIDEATANDESRDVPWA